MGGNVFFAVLLLRRARRPPQPRRVIMRWIPAGWRVLRCRKVCAICAGERSEIIVKGMVFLNDDHHVVDGIVRFHGLLRTSDGFPNQYCALPEPIVAPVEFLISSF